MESRDARPAVFESAPVSVATTLVGASRAVAPTSFALASVCVVGAESDGALESGFRMLWSCDFEAVVVGLSSWTIHAPHAMPTNAAMPKPFHM
jgi:hypothetical protein